MNETDRQHLRRCVELAAAALDAGDEPFGSVLVDAQGTVLFEDRNRVGGGDQTQHPELAIARWAGQHLDRAARRQTTTYTSGEHCPMCSAAHAWVGLGRIVFATSAAQTSTWYAELGAPPSPIRVLSIAEVAPDVWTEGPVPEFVDAVKDLHRRRLAHPG